MDPSINIIVQLGLEDLRDLKLNAEKILLCSSIMSRFDNGEYLQSAARNCNTAVHSLEVSIFSIDDYL